MIGNGISDELAKEGTKYEQTDLKSNLSELKTLIKTKFKENGPKIILLITKDPTISSTEKSKL